jgi:predicted HAD superfamily Cof-like phosphohydrolase
MPEVTAIEYFLCVEKISVLQHRPLMGRMARDPTFGSMKTMTGSLTLEEAIESVREFHDAFGIPNAHDPTGAIGDRDALLRYKLIREENEEYLDAAMRGDLVEVADALGDILYILCGTLLKHGLEHKIHEVFREIQRSNMSKLDASGRPIYRDDGKVLKSDRYSRPDIAAILNG